MMPKTDKPIEWAKSYAEKLGWSMHPMDPEDNTPATTHGCKDATTSLAQIEYWWRKNQNYIPAAATGDISNGLVVIECESGIDFVERWEKDNNTNLPITVTAASDDGKCFYFYKSALSYESNTNTSLGVNIHANDSSVILPSSSDESEYHWLFSPEKYEVKTITKAVKRFIEYCRTEPKVPVLNFVNAAELAKASLPEIYYSIEGLIPEGETILAAPPKTGKSWMVLQMALAVATGKPFLGFDTNKSDVLYFALEDGDKFEQERMLKLCSADNVPHNFHYVFQDVVNLDHGFIEQLEQARSKLPNIRLIIIDTLKLVKGNQKKNETAYDCDYRTGRLLKSWADKYGIALLVVTHTTKLIHPDDALANVSGTNGVTGAADAVMVIAKEKRTSTDAVLAVDGRRVRQSEHEIKIDWDKCQWQYVGLADPEERERRQRERELEVFRNSSAYKAIMLLAEQNVNGWKGKARKLIDDASDYGVFVTESPKEVGGMLTNNVAQLAQDGVRVEIIKNGTSGNIYRLSMWQSQKKFA